MAEPAYDSRAPMYSQQSASESYFPQQAPQYPPQQQASQYPAQQQQQGQYQKTPRSQAGYPRESRHEPRDDQYSSTRSGQQGNADPYEIPAYNPRDYQNDSAFHGPPPSSQQEGSDGQLALYDEEKAQANDLPPPPPPSQQLQPYPQSNPSRRVGFHDDDYDDREYDERRPRRSRRHRHRPDSQLEAMEKNGHSTGHRTLTHEEKGQVASTLGGAGGALLGATVIGGPIGAVGGILAGALGASKLEDKREERKRRSSVVDEDAKSRGYHSDRASGRGGARRSKKRSPLPPRERRRGYHSEDGYSDESDY